LLEILVSSSFSPSAQKLKRLGGFSLSFCKAKRKLGKEKTFFERVSEQLQFKLFLKTKTP